MTRRLSGLALTLLLLASIAGPAFGQDGGVTIESADVDEHPQVSLTVTVESLLIGEATPSFRILEDGVPRVVTATATASDDLKVVLLLDVSGSMQGDPLSGAKAAATQFIEEMPPGVQVAVVAFGSTASLAAEFTDDKPTLLSAISLLRTQGETALYDGVFSAAALLANETEAGRTIVLLSDGGDTVSSRSLDEAVEALSDVGAAFYAVELQSPENDREALELLAEAAAGSVISADDPDALEATFGDIASELLSSYRLEFTTDAFDLATLDVFVVVRGAVVASGTRIVQLPAAPTVADPNPGATGEPEVVVQPEPEPLPSPRAGTFVELSWLETDTARWLGAATIFLAASIVFTVIALRPRSRRAARGTSTLTPSASQKAGAKAKRTPLSVIAESASSLAEDALNRGDRLQGVNAALERAGVALRPGEFLVLVASAALAAAAVGVILVGPWVGLLLAAVVVMVFPMWLSGKARERSNLFNEQLGDTLQLMSASMRAGYGLLQAVDAVAEEAPSPTAEEFQRIKVETHLGRDLDDSLQAAASRVDSEDFRWVAEAIQIHRQIGGDLAEILDAVNETIRDRNRIRRRVKALSAEGRISAVILSLIPVVLGIVITIINPSYIGELPASTEGQFLLVGGAIAWVIAVFWMRRIVRLVF
ncbi:MAG: type II secretion system F family protein [Acidimicrobiia bacterium]